MYWSGILSVIRLSLTRPGTMTVMTMDSNSAQASLDQIPLWVGVADYVGLDPYPCRQNAPGNFAWIDAIIEAPDPAARLLGSLAGVRRLDVALADGARGAAHALPMGYLPPVGVRGVRLDLGRAEPVQPARSAEGARALQQRVPLTRRLHYPGPNTRAV